MPRKVPVTLASSVAAKLSTFMSSIGPSAPAHHLTAIQCPLLDLHTSEQRTYDPGWRGPVYLQRSMPTIDWVLPGSGESNKEWEFCSLYLQLVCGRTLPFLTGPNYINVTISEQRFRDCQLLESEKSGRKGPRRSKGMCASAVSWIVCCQTEQR